MVIGLLTLLFIAFCFQFCFIRDTDRPGAYEQEHATQLYSCHGVFIERFIFRSNLL